MNITVCGSVSFLKEMKSLKDELLNLGFDQVLIPIGFGKSDAEMKKNWTVEESAKRKLDLDLINEHWRKITKSDCILVANYEKKNILGYIGGNTFLEMGFAFVLGKPIFVLNKIPKMDYESELIGLNPIVINGDLSKIRSHYTLN